MELTDDDPDAFGHLVDWVYMERLKCKMCPPRTDGGWGPSFVPFPRPVDPTHELQWLRLWILADRLNLLDLGQAALYQHTKCLSSLAISPEAVALVCDNTAEDSALRTHLVKDMLETIFSRSPEDGGSNGLGLAAAANPIFNQQVMDAIQQHLRIPQQNNCNLCACSFHASYAGWG
jgi:hypothetical protein